MIRRFLEVIKQLYCRIQDDEVPALGAQLTYYLILSFFPFLIFVLTILSHTRLASNDMLIEMFRLLPESSYKMVTGIVNETIRASSGTLLSVGMLAAIWTSSSGLMAIIRGINKAYDTAENRAFWKVRLLAIGYTLVLAFLILLTIVLLVFGEVIGRQLFTYFLLPESWETVWNIGKVAIPLGMMAVVFMLLYMQAPNYRVRMSDAWPGTLFAIAGWVGTSYLFAFYVNNFGNYARTYGSIGGIIVLLIWLYLSSIVILLGGELNATLQFMRENRKKSDCKIFGFTLPWFRSAGKDSGTSKH